MNLNTIRLEGKFESDTLFKLADEYPLSHTIPPYQFRLLFIEHPFISF